MVVAKTVNPVIAIVALVARRVIPLATLLIAEPNVVISPAELAIFPRPLATAANVATKSPRDKSTSILIPLAISLTPRPALSAAVPIESRIFATPSRTFLTALPNDSITAPTPSRADFTPFPNPSKAVPRPVNTSLIVEPTDEITVAMPLNTAVITPVSDWITALMELITPEIPPRSPVKAPITRDTPVETAIMS